MRIFLVDGHNVLHRISKLPELYGRNRREALNLLLHRLADALSSTDKAMVFLDGTPLNLDRTVGIHCQFSGSNKTADEFIIARLKSKKHRLSIVVSNDKAIIDEAIKNERSHMSCEEFLAINSTSIRSAKKTPLESDIIVSEREVSDMMLWFKIKQQFGNDE